MACKPAFPLAGSSKVCKFSSLIVLNAWIDTALVENGKFLLAARKFRRATSTDYIISINSEDMSRGSTTYVGKLRYSQVSFFLKF